MAFLAPSGASSRPSASMEYMPLDDVERLERYRPGGYHPVLIGDRFHDRYDVESKKYVVIKIATAEADPQEGSILSSLALSAPRNPFISQVLDEFSLQGPNGTHRCLVREPAMMSLSQAKDASYVRLFQLPVAKSIVAQVVQAVTCLHSQGIVHADLHEGNIMLRLPRSIDELSPEQLYDQYGQPHLEPIVPLDNKPLPEGVPTHAVLPIWLGKDSEQVMLSEARIFLTDFGESFMPSITERHYSNTPTTLVPPEVYFLPQQSLTFPSGIWTLACTLWTMLGQRTLFEGFHPSNDFMIKEHVDALGRLPEEWWKEWNARGRWFTEERVHGSQGGQEDSRRDPGMECMGEIEQEVLLDLFRGMLAFKPDKRLTAREVLESEWMVKWVLAREGNATTNSESQQT
ncbi:kinase-like protein [Aspergillus ellipticus CBS 707.79]|uniref:Kinase-like protein n=1 Tax=Aspergillus ellipticus CBS 707.79 TaxID=1448320 RepID=A0A319CZH2_9EURO|nr:kinase-like protein [Aspergillus ellipticus CBS 707.79]